MLHRKQNIVWFWMQMTTVGYGDIHPTTAAEEGVVMILMITHIMLFGLLIGSVSELMKTASKQARNAEAFSGKMDVVTSWLKERRVPSKLQKKVFVSGAQFMVLWSQHTFQMHKHLSRFSVIFLYGEPSLVKSPVQTRS